MSIRGIKKQKILLIPNFWTAVYMFLFNFISLLISKYLYFGTNTTKEMDLFTSERTYGQKCIYYHSKVWAQVRFF